MGNPVLVEEDSLFHRFLRDVLNAIERTNQGIQACSENGTEELRRLVEAITLPISQTVEVPVLRQVSDSTAIEKPAKKKSKNKRAFIKEAPSSLNDQEKLHRVNEKTRLALAELDQTRLQPNGHDQWLLPPEGPIVVYGEQIWPTADRRYDWRAAYYGFHLWKNFDEISQETSVTERGRRLLNPIGPIFCHISGPVGIVIQKIGNAMCDRPSEYRNVRGPGKILQGR